MHVILIPVGSSGDVHPFLGIGRGLKRRGHDVLVISSEPFRQVAEREGLAFEGVVTTEQFDQVIADPSLWHPTRGFRLIMELVAASMRRGYEVLERHYRPGESVLVAHTLAFAARVFQEHRAAPLVSVHIAPSLFRSDHLQPAFAPGRDFSWMPRWQKRAFWRLADRFMIDPPIVPALNRWRSDLGLPPVSRVFQDWMHAPQRVLGLFPDWFGAPQPDWPAQTRLASFPLFDEADQHEVDTALDQFLTSGDPPILFTAGSVQRHASALFGAAVECSRLLGRRALLVTRYPDQLPLGSSADVRHVSYVPFSRVLPRCAALVHHGGIGTCAQGLAAGIPQVVIPMAFDQPDNATRLRRLGVARWVVPRRLSARRLADALHALLTDADVAPACALWHTALAERDGAAEACDVIEEVMENAQGWEAGSHGDP